MRTLVIGDIHGALRALVQVLERADIQADDYLIFLIKYSFYYYSYKILFVIF